MHRCMDYIKKYVPAHLGITWVATKSLVENVSTVNYYKKLFYKNYTFAKNGRMNCGTLKGSNSHKFSWLKGQE